MPKAIFSTKGHREIVENMGAPNTNDRGSPGGLSDDGANRSLVCAALIAALNQSRAKHHAAEVTLVTILHSLSASGILEDSNKLPVSDNTVSGSLHSLKGQSG